MKTTIVVPIKNELRNLFDFIDNKYYWGGHAVIMVDDSTDDVAKGIIEDVEEIQYLEGVGNYGDSLIWGMMNGGCYDKLIVMDIDHPVDKLDEMIKKLNTYDVVVGNDTNKGYARYVTGFLCNTILRMNLKHPTCGFIGFNDYVTRKNHWKNICFYEAHSKRDIVHVEWLKVARMKGLKIGEVDFESYAVHDYTLKRCVRWLIDFLLMSIRCLFGAYP